MPSLAKILESTMLATAAFGRDAGFDILAELKRDERLAPVRGSPKPPSFGGGVGILDILPFPIGDMAELIVLQGKIKSARLWRWTYDSGQVQEVADVTCRTRSMHGKALKVCDKIVFREVRVKFFGKPEMVMPLQPKYELGRVFLDEGRIPARGSGLWQLRARTDPSFMNVLAYQLDAGDVWEPIPLETLVDMGDDAMPQPPILDHLKFKFTGNNVVTAKVAKPRVIVALSLVCCKERNDCEPAEALGAARIYPQIMVMGNVNLEHVEATIELSRPSKSMHAEHHPDDMEEDIESILFTDTNEDHTVNCLPIPRWEEVFDYYQLDPYKFLENRTEIPDTAPEGTLPGEVCVVDRNASLRTIEKAVSRYNPDFEGDPYMNDREVEQAFYSRPSSIRKLDRQGEFDNLHLAPHMRQAFEIAKSSANGPALKYDDDIIMAPFCVHDCLHTHFRWGDLTLPPLMSLPKSNKGWHGGHPYSQVGAPLVPENQSVYISLPKKHVVRYRAVAHKAFAGAWTIFNHHGSYYATGEWPMGLGDDANIALSFAKGFVWAYTNGREPWTNGSWGEMPSALDSWPALYWRLRFGGYQNPDRPQRNHVFERLTFNLAKCLR